MKRAVVSWSGGKDSTLALHQVTKNSQLEVTGLLTTVSEEYDRTSIHGIRTALVERQAEALGLDLQTIELPEDISGKQYVDFIADVFESYADRGINRLVLGDVRPDDDDTYREEALEEAELKTFYPLLGWDTADLVGEFVNIGYEATTVCVQSESLGQEFLGRTVDEDFLKDLPADVDPNGEDGEYHTFVVDGPLFDFRVETTVGKTVEQFPGGEKHYYCDLMPQ